VRVDIGGEALEAATAFLEAFRKVHGRAPRILHVGNIANNAYLNAKILNRHGFDCDVICADYYHIMGCPEWEEVDFSGTIADHFRPDWTSVDLGGYQRPRWFVQGPRETCVDYLVAKRTGQQRKADALWRHLGWANKTLPPNSGTEPASRNYLRRLRYAFATVRRLTARARHYPDAYSAARAKMREWGDERGTLRRVLVSALVPFGLAFVWLVRLSGPLSRAIETVRTGSSWDVEWPARFKAAFPDRADQLSAHDCAAYIWTLPDWRRLFEHYDIVQAYATEVMLPMFAGKRPYLGFEHGTLRVFTLGDNALCRLTALGYNRADHVFITNGDCLAYAHEIKVKSFTPMPHPFDDAFMASVRGQAEKLRAHYGASRLFLCPLRHDWEIKGTDKYIRALPRIAERIGRDFRVIMTEWGAQVEESKRLARSLGVEDLIVWHEPFTRVQLVEHLKSVDVVFDQIALPCFGGTAPQAIASRVPVIMSYDPASTEWLIPEPAPILTAWNAEQVADAVLTAVDSSWRAQYEPIATRWYSQYHSAQEVVRKHAEAYMRVCRSTGLLPLT
jgi:hypothetical protein